MGYCGFTGEKVDGRNRRCSRTSSLLNAEDRCHQCTRFYTKEEADRIPKTREEAKKIIDAFIK